MADYEQTQQIEAPAGEVFAWLSDVANLPSYLPPVEAASTDGPSDGPHPGMKLRTTLTIPDEAHTTFEAEGYLSVDETAQTMEWGAEGGRDYSGSLTVTDAGDGHAAVTVHLTFGPRSIEGDAEPQAGEPDPIEEGIAATLESIRRQIEDGSGKVAPPVPEHAEFSMEDNPAVHEK